MFICEKCHEESGCEWVHLSGSIGPCEVCKQQAACHDCNPPKEAKQS